MPISSTSLLTLATPAHKVNTPGIRGQIARLFRDRLEWTWGLGHGRLDEHLREFSDPHRVFMNDSLLVFPPTDIIRKISSRGAKTKSDVRRAHIQKVYKGCTSFQYLVVPVDPCSDVPAHTLVSNVPPHLALCTTSSKIMRAWGHLKGRDYNAIRLSLVERIQTARLPDPLRIGVSDLNTMRSTHWSWILIDYVPPSFLSEDSDQAEVAESVRSLSDSGFSSNMAWEVGSSASCYHEPKRRLLPSERQADFPSANIRMFPSTDGMQDDDDDAMSEDSHVPGGEDPDEGKARAAPEDDEADLAWTKGISQWAKGASEADADTLNDAQIKQDSREPPRFAASLDLAKPDYEDVAAKKGLRTNV
ncbi:hypothetical protein DFH06DRAFT_1322686 [Mycena polygramma]|nr:hypothetical protein DFH06DRAFT_1322686 [Mycena polygramma]